MSFEIPPSLSSKKPKDGRRKQDLLHVYEGKETSATYLHQSLVQVKHRTLVGCILFPRWNHLLGLE